MTTTEPPPTEHEPDHELDRQAAAEGLTARARTPHGAASGTPSHDADAETAVLDVMLTFPDASLGILDHGLEPHHFYSHRNGLIYEAICRTITDGDTPDYINVAARLTTHGITPPDLFAITNGGYQHSARRATSYARIVTGCYHARQLQGRALEVAAAAQAGQLDEAIRLTTVLTDHIPAGTADTTWAPIDLAAVLDGDTTAPHPDLLHVEGAAALFYTGRTNLIFGESGAGKTWIALAAVAELVHAGVHVIYIDLEDTPAGLVARLLLLGLTRDQIRSCVHYVQPDVAWSPSAQATLAAVIERHNVGLVVLDSTGEAMAADGVKGNDDDDVARWFTAGPRYIARRGPAVVVIDHIPKDNQHAPLDPIGSQRKKAAVDGASYRIDSPKPPSIAQDGLLIAVCSKDRHGHHTRGLPAASITVGHDPDGTVLITLAAPEKPPTDDDGNKRYTHFMEQISLLLEDGQARSGNAIESSVRGNARGKREALRVLVVEGYVTATTVGTGFSYRSQKPYREATDPIVHPDAEAPDDL